MTEYLLQVKFTKEKYLVKMILSLDMSNATEIINVSVFKFFLQEHDKR